MKIRAPKRLIFRGTPAPKPAVIKKRDGTLEFPAVLTTEKPGYRWFRDPETGNYKRFLEIVTVEGMDLSRGATRPYKMYYGHNSADLPLGDWNGVYKDGDYEPYPALRAKVGRLVRSDGVVHNWWGEQQPVSAVRAAVLDGTMDAVSIGYDVYESKVVRKGEEWEGYKAEDDDLWVWTRSALYEASLVPEPFDELAQVGRLKSDGSPWTPEELFKTCSTGEHEINCEIIAPRRAMLTKSETPTSAPRSASAGAATDAGDPSTAGSPASPENEREQAMDREKLIETIKRFLADNPDETTQALVEDFAPDVIDAAYDRGLKAGLEKGEEFGIKSGIRKERDHRQAFEEHLRAVALDPENPYDPKDPYAQELLAYYDEPPEAIERAVRRLRAARGKPLGLRPREQEKKEVTEPKFYTEVGE